MKISTKKLNCDSSQDVKLLLKTCWDNLLLEISEKKSFMKSNIYEAYQQHIRIFGGISTNYGIFLKRY